MPEASRFPRRRIGLLLATLGGIVLGIVPVSAQTLPPIVQAEIQDSKKSCEPDRATLLAGFVTAKDINGDGRDDYILDYAKFQCGDSASFFCGSAGCLTQVFASLPGGAYAKVLDENVRRIRFAPVKGRPAMLLDLHGTACNKTGAAPCAMTLFWNGSTFSPAN
jgi:hypothetical protein